MNRVLIWDLPTRVFHWLLSGGFIAAAVIALALGEHSPLFPYHAIIGLTIALMVCLRVIWGIAGTRYARFGTFIFGPAAVIEYMKGTLVGGTSRADTPRRTTPTSTTTIARVDKRRIRVPVLVAGQGKLLYWNEHACFSLRSAAYRRASAIMDV